MTQARGTSVFAYLARINQVMEGGADPQTKDLSEFFGTSVQASLRFVATLEQDGYITRSVEGRTYVNYQITEKGKHFLAHGVQQ